MSDGKKPIDPSRIVRNKPFAKRLVDAVASHPDCPEGRGAQKWLRDALAEKYQIETSAESVRKWFHGEAKPRQPVMKCVADFLRVDEAWLHLGLTPEIPVYERHSRNVRAEGAVSVVSGMIQMAGGTCAFPTSKDSDIDRVDFYAIIGGRKLSIKVVVVEQLSNDFMLRVPVKCQDLTIIGLVVGRVKAKPDFIRVEGDSLASKSRSRGGYREMVFTKEGNSYQTEGERIDVIRDFACLAE